MCFLPQSYISLFMSAPALHSSTPPINDRKSSNDWTLPEKRSLWFKELSLCATHKEKDSAQVPRVCGITIASMVITYRINTYKSHTLRRRKSIQTFSELIAQLSSKQVSLKKKKKKQITRRCLSFLLRFFPLVVFVKVKSFRSLVAPCHSCSL